MTEIQIICKSENMHSVAHNMIAMVTNEEYQINLGRQNLIGNYLY